jgi:hypothetical protein
MGISINFTSLVSTGDNMNVVETSEVLVPYSYFDQTGSYKKLIKAIDNNFDEVIFLDTITNPNTELYIYNGFYLNGIILRNHVYYKHAVNHKYLTDLGPYRYGDDTSFNFQQNFYDGYYKYFDDKPKNFKINNSSNE